MLIFFSENKKKDGVGGGNPLWMSDDVEFWPEKEGAQSHRFNNIAALHSELIAVSTNGQLHQWKWSETEPFKNSDVCCIVIESINVENFKYRKD